MSRQKSRKAKPATPRTIRPPQWLAPAPEQFWCTAVPLDRLDPPVVEPGAPILKRLGPPPFRRGNFPLLGFLASVYDHVACCAEEALQKARHE